MDNIHLHRKHNAWRTFLKSVGWTLAAIALIALGFFGAMAVSGFFM